MHALEKKQIYFEKIFSSYPYDILLFNPTYDLFINDVEPSQSLLSYWQKFVDSKKENQPLNLYIHTPFCASHCKFCQFSTIALQDNSQIDTYLKQLEQLLTEFHSFLRKVEFSSLYFGGGTPSIYNEEQLSRLLGILNKHIHLKENLQDAILRCFEVNPVLTNQKKLALMREYGINRVSFGVQTFNKEILARENRAYISPERLKELIDSARSLGYCDINLDLILGLNGESAESIYDSLTKALEIQPDHITFYIIQGSPKEKSAFYSPHTSFRKQLLPVVEECEKIASSMGYHYEYVPGRVINIYKNPAPFTTFYSEFSMNDDSVFCIGPGTFGRIHNALRYKMRENIFSCELFSIDEKDEMTSFILESLRRGGIDVQQFMTVFNKNFETLFSDELEYLMHIDKMIHKNNRYKFVDGLSKKQMFIHSSLFFSSHIFNKYIELFSSKREYKR